MKQFYEIGDYSQIVEFNEKGKIIDMTCSCKWGSLYSNNFKEGNKICSHLKKLIQQLKE